MAPEERFGPTRRGGPVFRWLGEPLAIDLANTVMVVRPGEVVDLIAAEEDLQRWLGHERDRLPASRGRPPTDALKELRDAIRALLTARIEGDDPNPKDLALLNSASSASPVVPRLEVPPGGAGWSATLVPSPTKRSTDALGPIARSAIEILASSDAERLGVCRAPSCGMFFLGARKWCCAACGNRARAARHYGRKRAASSA